MTISGKNGAIVATLARCALLVAACRGSSPHAEPARHEPPRAPVAQRFSCEGVGCPPPEELKRLLGGCASSVRLENGRIEVEVTVAGGVRQDGSDSGCARPVGGIRAGR